MKEEKDAPGDGTHEQAPAGQDWTPQKTGTNSWSLNDIAHGAGQFVVVEEYEDDGTILSSADGKAWTGQISGTYKLLSVTHGVRQFIAVGRGGPILASADGKVWTRQASGTEIYLNGVTHGAGQFVAVGDYDTILTSAECRLRSHAEVRRVGRCR